MAEKRGFGHPFHHLASFNLFIESDGKIYVTVAGGGSIEHVMTVGAECGLDVHSLKPADVIIELVKLAENIK